MRERFGLFLFILGLALFFTFLGGALLAAYFDPTIARIVSTAVIALILLISFVWGTALLIKERSILGLATLLVGLNVLRAFILTLGWPADVLNIITAGMAWFVVGTVLWTVLKETHVLRRGATAALTIIISGGMALSGQAQALFLGGGVIIFGLAAGLFAIWVGTKIAGKFMVRWGLRGRLRMQIKKQKALVKEVGRLGKQLEEQETKIGEAKKRYASDGRLSESQRRTLEYQIKSMIEERDSIFERRESRRTDLALVEENINKIFAQMPPKKGKG